MKLTQAFQILLVSSASYAITESTSIDVDKIKNNECGNSVSFSSSFQTDTGEECSECSFCGGANLNALFNPNIASTCIECAKENTKCTSFRVVTAFNKPWLMEFFSLTSSDETSDTDPEKITLVASNDAKAWSELYDSKVVFSDRSKAIEFLTNNDKSFKYFALSFQRKKTSTKIHLGHYGLVPSYTKSCTSNLYGLITGNKILPYDTMPPTEAPTNAQTNVPYTMTDSNIQTAVALWKDNNSAAIAEYGHIKNWDVSRVTSMRVLFHKTRFNDDISRWDVSRVIDMFAMFGVCRDFNQDLSAWNVSSVTSFSWMFDSTEKFNQDLSNWDVSSATSLSRMFKESKSFDQSVCWDVSDVDWLGTQYMFIKSSGCIDSACCPACDNDLFCL